MKADIHPKYQDAEIRCACGNVIKTRSTKPTILLGICNVCHTFYTGTQKFVDTAGRVDKFQQRLAVAAWAACVLARLRRPPRRKRNSSLSLFRPPGRNTGRADFFFTMDLRPHIDRFARRLAEVEAALS